MSKKIFIINGDANILYGLQAKFSATGFSVDTSVNCHTADDILCRAAAYTPDYIILDIMLCFNHAGGKISERADGFSILKKIKSDERILRVPVFIFSGEKNKDIKKKSLDMGAEYYFPNGNIMIDDFISRFVKMISNRERRT